VAEKQDTKKQTSEPRNKNLIVGLGASAGGIQEIIKIVELLPSWFEGTLIVATHRHPDQPNVLADVLAHRARITVDEPLDEKSVECTHIYVGKPAEKVEVDGEEFDVEQNRTLYGRIHRIDDLFFSIAESAGRNGVGVILTGMLADGVKGLKAIHDAGGKCLVQDPDQAAWRSMPEKALQAVPVAFVGTTEEIASQIMELSFGRECEE
jgi:two-component system chemotaxis response regulator CheB